MPSSDASPRSSAVWHSTAACHTRSPLGAVAQRTVELHADDAAALIRRRPAPCLVVGTAAARGSRAGRGVALSGIAQRRGAVRTAYLRARPRGRGRLRRPAQAGASRRPSPPADRAAVDAFFELVCPGIWHVLDNTRRDAFRDNAPEPLRRPPDAALRHRSGRPAGHHGALPDHPRHRRPPGLPADRPGFGHAHPGADLVELTASGHVTSSRQPDASHRR